MAALAISQVLYFLLAALLVSLNEESASQTEQSIRIVVTAAVYGAFGAYYLLIIHWCCLADTVWGYIWRAYLLLAASKFIVNKLFEVFDLARLSIHGVLLDLLVPWGVAWMLLRYERQMRRAKLTENVGKYE